MIIQFDHFFAPVYDSLLLNSTKSSENNRFQIILSSEETLLFEGVDPNIQQWIETGFRFSELETYSTDFNEQIHIQKLFNAHSKYKNRITVPETKKLLKNLGIPYSDFFAADFFNNFKDDETISANDFQKIYNKLTKRSDLLEVFYRVVFLRMN